MITGYIICYPVVVKINTDYLLYFIFTVIKDTYAVTTIYYKTISRSLSWNNTGE